MINVATAIRAKNNTLRSLFSEYSSLKFIAINKTLVNKPRMYLGTVTDGWYYKQRKHPVTGEVKELLFFVPKNAVENSWIDSSTSIELAKTDGTFLRFDFVGGGKLKPQAPKMEWEVSISPNAQDIIIIT